MGGGVVSTAHKVTTRSSIGPRTLSLANQLSSPLTYLPLIRPMTLLSRPVAYNPNRPLDAVALTPSSLH